MALPNIGEQFKEKLTAVGDWFEQQEWYQEIKSKFDGLDPAHKLYVKAGGSLVILIALVGGLGSIASQVHTVKKEYHEKLGLLALINTANEELKTLKNQIGSNTLAMTEGGAWSNYFETLVTASGVDVASFSVANEKAGVSNEQSKETLLDISLKHLNIKQIIRVTNAIETGPRPTKLRNLTIDTKNDPEGYLDANLSVSAFKMIQQ